MSKFMIFNGSRKGLFVSMVNQIRPKKNTIIMMDVSEEELFKMRNSQKHIQAYYLYDISDLSDKTIHDIGPIMNLYNGFVKVTKD